MRFAARFVCLPFSLAAAICLPAALTAAEPLRSQAIVDLSFDEPSGDALDAAGAGTHKDNGNLVNAPERVASPFWAQSGKKALQFDAARSQFVQIADSPDLDRADAVTLSFFFLSLHELGDTAFHGIVAKRAAAEPAVTNYGINYMPKNDAFQVYVHFGSGYRVATYSVKNLVGYSRLAHLTATFETADAPAPDADEDKDDLRIALYLNGQPVKPVGANGGTVVGNDAWIVDVNAQGLLNDVPLTIGSTNPQTEFTTCLIDEFLLFPRALSAEDAAKLFVEVAGENAAELARKELEPPPAPPVPRIGNVSLRGLQIGKTTRVAISGQNLGPSPRVELPVPGLQQKIVGTPAPSRLDVELTIPKDTPAGFYPLRVATADGLSDAEAMAIDHLVQRPIASVSADKPAELPAAFSGNVAQAEQQRVYFRGNAGQRLVAEVEAKRLGARMDPVLEVKTERGTPLAIQWGHAHLRGDARAELTLPADGLYYVELHDLAYKAPGRSPFRLKLGDLALVDAFFPAVLPAGQSRTVEPVGIGLAAGASVPAQMPTEATRPAVVPALPVQLSAAAPSAAVRASSAVEVVESAAEGQPAAIDARFTGPKHVPLMINGRISEPGQQDVHTLTVTPGQALTLQVLARDIDSPLDAELSVLRDGNVQMVKEEAGTSREPRLDYTPPADVGTIQIAVRDLYGRGGLHFLYRLKVVPAGQPDFSLTVSTPKVDLPDGGSAVIELQVNRAGYNGPIALSVAGDPDVMIAPAQLNGSGKVFATLVRKRAQGQGESEGPTDASERTRVASLQIIGESVGLDPALRRAAEVTPGPGEASLPGHETILPAAAAGSSDFAVALGDIPAGLYKGANFALPVTVTRLGEAAGRAVRFTLVSTEATRRVDPNPASPNKALKPLVRSLPSQTLAAGVESGAVNIAVPLDIAEPSIDFVLKAELVPHAYSPHVLGTAYSAPFRLNVQSAAAVTIDPASLTMKLGGENKLTGVLKRAEGFTGNVDLALAELPQGFMSAKVTVPPGQDRFEIPVTPPAGAAVQTVNAQLVVTATSGGPILPNQPTALKFEAP